MTERRQGPPDRYWGPGTRRQWRRHGRPHWWPEGEAWPPHGRRHWNRGTFVARAAIFLGAMLFLLVGATTLGVLFVLRAPGLLGLPAAAGPVLLLLLVMTGFAAIALGLRRAITPFGGWTDAVQRVEAGDYTVRAPERGPRDLRRLAAAFNAMTKRLEEDAEQRRRLMADVTHELRTPLTTIQGQIEGMIDGVYPADEAHLAPLLDETKVLSRLIDDLRTLSLAESGALPLRREVTDLDVLVGETIAAFRSHAEAAGVRLEARFLNDVPLIEVDPVRMREVLSNLITNALRYTPRDGSIVVEGSADANAVTLVVRDTGFGIAADDLPHIFDRFHRSSESRGSGLGLSIAKSLIEAHGGEISAASEPSKGTAILMRLPLTA